MPKTTIKASNNVNYDFKILYALGIIFIVMGHCNGGGISVFNEFFPFYSFHIALFIFASGYFYNSQNESSVKNFILKKTQKLIIPLYLWNFLYACIMQTIKHFGFFPSVHVNLETLFITPIINGHQFLLNLAGWFIIPLYMIHVINILVRKVFFKFNIKINEFIYFGICLLLGLIGVSLSAHGYNRDWFLVLDRVLYFLPFYSLGILYRKYEKYDKQGNLVYFGTILFISLMLIYKYNSMPIVIPSWADFGTHGTIMPFIVGILGIAFWLRISKILSPSIGQNKYINILADNTYTIMINHLLGAKIVNTFFALLYKYTNLCSGFNMESYKTMWNYFYLPHNLPQFLVLYVLFGIIFSIAFQKIILYATNPLKKLFPSLRNFQ